MGTLLGTRRAAGYEQDWKCSSNKPRHLGCNLPRARGDDHDQPRCGVCRETTLIGSHKRRQEWTCLQQQLQQLRPNLVAALRRRTGDVRRSTLSCAVDKEMDGSCWHKCVLAAPSAAHYVT